MNLSTLSIRRPVLAIVMSTVIVLLGVVGATFLGVRQFPDVDPPEITVQTTYAGASAEVVESQITEPLEESINGIAGIRSVTSSSSYGRSSITVEFELGVDLETAANDVRDRVDQARRRLPADVDPPQVSKSNANSSPVVIMSVYSTKRSLMEVSEYAATTLKERLQTIEGVAEIVIWGERTPAMRVVLQPANMAAYGLSPNAVRAALQRENIELPTGRVEGLSTELTLRTKGRLSTIEEFEDVILRSDERGVVRLADVALIRLGATNERTILKRDGVPMVAMAVRPQPGANQVNIASSFRKRVDELRPQVPADITLEIRYDASTFINAAITEVVETLAIAFALVIVIIFVFLRNWRATFIPVIAIPVSLVASFFVMWIGDFSINLLTMLGIVLSTGLVVDDAIVVMENIYKRIERGDDPVQAGNEGASEIYFAVISTTITLIAVFVPIIFLQGLTGRLFREFGFVVATSIVVSAFVSLTLTPMMSTRLLRRRQESSLLERATEPFFVWLNGLYDRSVRFAVDRAWMAALFMVVSAGVIWQVGGGLPSEVAPLEDRSQLRIIVVAPEGYTYERMDAFLDTFRATVERLVPEKDLVLTVTSPSFIGSGTNSGFGRIQLIDPALRERSQMEIADQLTAAMRSNPEARTIIQQEPTISSGFGGGGLPVQFVIQAQELADLRRVIPVVLDAANASPLFNIVDCNLKFTKPELSLRIRRDRARELGVSVADIAEALQAGFSSQRFGYFLRGGRQYDVIGEIDRWQRMTPDEIMELTIQARDGSLVQLTDLVTITEESAPPQLYHYNRAMSATISAGLAPGVTIDKGIAEMDRIAAEVLDDTFTTALTGPSLDFKESSSSIVFAFLLALVLVYLVLAAQFESFVDPLIIMLTVPLALAGAVVSLAALGQTLNIFSQIGTIVLIGIVTKNGILIVEFANQLRARGASWHDAAIQAASMRFRPILMTSAATILGALPIALSLGAASESRVGLGVVVVGGMVFSTVLTLIVVPSLYVLLSRIKRSAIVAAAIVLLAAPSAQASDTLTYQQAIAIALEQSFGVRVARQDSLLAENIGAASISGFLPRLDLSGQYVDGANDITQRLADGRTINQDGVGYSNLQANAVLQWTLFDGLRMFATADRAAALRSEGLASVRARMQSLVADVLTAYNTIVATQRFLHTADSALVLAEERYRLERHRYEVGSVSGVEVAQAEIDRNSQKALVIKTQADLAVASSALNTLLARDPETAFAVPITISIPPMPSLTEIFALIDAANPDVIRARYALQAASAHVREATAALMPQIGVQGAYRLSRATSDGGFFLENLSNGPSLGVTFQWNLFNGLADRYERERRVILEQQQHLSEESIRNDLRGSAERTLRMYTASGEVLGIQQQSYAAAERNAMVALEKLRVGSITPLEVRQTFQTLLEVGAQVAQLEYQQRLAATEILRICGRLMD